MGEASPCECARCKSRFAPASILLPFTVPAEVLLACSSLRVHTRSLRSHCLVGTPGIIVGLRGLGVAVEKLRVRCRADGRVA